MTARGDKTRESLLDAAERLFGERGVAGVSMREIRLASGARNTAALQFHFGDRQGLIRAVTARHLPRIGERQQRIHDEIVAEGRIDDPRSLVEVLVRPVAEYLTLGPSERAWVKIQAELGTLPDVRLIDLVAYAPDAALAAGNRLFQQIHALLPDSVAVERMMLAAQAMVHLCADRARLDDDPSRSPSSVSDAVFLQNLIDMIHGALFATPSAATTALLDARAPRR
jgi:AcrR family transcriptional regulator